MKTLNISDETYELIKNQLGVEEKISISSLEDFVGKKFFIRMVTYHLVGRITKVMANLFVMEDSSWVADSGGFSDAIKKGLGENAEIEPVGQSIININAIVDMFPYNHSLPTKQQ
jgi:hypothetical protein